VKLRLSENSISFERAQGGILASVAAATEAQDDNAFTLA